MVLLPLTGGPTMRFSIVAAACGISIALLAGCSAMRGSADLPSSGISRSSAIADGLGVAGGFQKIHYPPPGTGYEGMLKWFAEGKMPGPAPRWFMKQWL